MHRLDFWYYINSASFVNLWRFTKKLSLVLRFGRCQLLLILVGHFNLKIQMTPKDAAMSLICLVDFFQKQRTCLDSVSLTTLIPLVGFFRLYCRSLVNRLSFTIFSICFWFVYKLDTEFLQRIECDASRLAFVRYKDLLDDVEMTARNLLNTLQYQIVFSEIDVISKSKESVSNVSNFQYMKQMKGN
jgi:hypothetical protein